MQITPTKPCWQQVVGSGLTLAMERKAQGLPVTYKALYREMLANFRTVHSKWIRQLTLDVRQQLSKIDF